MIYKHIKKRIILKGAIISYADRLLRVSLLWVSLLWVSSLLWVIQVCVEGGGEGIVESNV